MEKVRSTAETPGYFPGGSIVSQTIVIKEITLWSDRYVQIKTMSRFILFGDNLLTCEAKELIGVSPSLNVVASDPLFSAASDHCLIEDKSSSSCYFSTKKSHYTQLIYIVRVVCHGSCAIPLHLADNCQENNCRNNIYIIFQVFRFIG